MNTFVAVVLGILGSGGLWGFVQYLIDTKIKKREQVMDEINTKLDKVATASELMKILEEMSILKNDIAHTKDLALSSARNTLSQLSNRYLELGYIPEDEFVAYKAIGDSYLAAGGNTEIKTKFEYVMRELKVKCNED